MTGWSLKLLQLLLLTTLVSSAPFARHSPWAQFSRRNRHFKPFQPRPVKFARPIQGFSNIFQSPSYGGSTWGGSSGFPAKERISWGSYPFNNARRQPLPPVQNTYQSYVVPQRPAAARRRQHHFRPANRLRPAQTPSSFVTDADIHGMVCVPASSLNTALAGGHEDTRVITTPDGKVTTHKTVLTGRHGNTEHSTRITSGDSSTVVETRTNSTSGVQQHQQSVSDTGTGLVRTSTGSAFTEGNLGVPSYAGVVTSSETGAGSSVSHASATGYSGSKPVPASSVSRSESGLDAEDDLPALPALEFEDDQTQELTNQPDEAPEPELDTAADAENVIDMEQNPGGDDADDEDVYRDEEREVQEDDENEIESEEEREEGDVAGSENEE